MPLDPADERWIRDNLGLLNDQVRGLIDDLRTSNNNFLTLHRRVKALERIRAALFAGIFGLAAVVGGAIYWAGGVAEGVKQGAEARAAAGKLADEFHEHERRTSPPRPEPVK